MTCQDSFHEVAFNISFWTRNISSARILFWRGVLCIYMCLRDFFRQLEAYGILHERAYSTSGIGNHLESLK